ncbi:MAG TPA: CopG family ribbon-helix-helix protein [Cellvibrio sp.]|nr:CopG family ribbon-helix-helix protein [Cellvibrio sp.]
MSTTMTIRLDDDLKERLTKLADATHRSKSFLATEAIRDFVELNEWQVQEIQHAVAAADKREFASEDQVKDVFKKWGVNAN